MTVVIGGLFLRESRHVRIWDEVGGHEMEPTYDDVPAGAPAT
jgi:hypothetical protein